MICIFGTSMLPLPRFAQITPVVIKDVCSFWQTSIQAFSFANAQGSWKIIQTFGPPVSETSSISDTLMENHTRPGAFAFFLVS